MSRRSHDVDCERCHERDRRTGSKERCAQNVLPTFSSNDVVAIAPAADAHALPL